MTSPGGYRKPANPAPVSGPGKMSRRTDGGPAQRMAQLPDAGYGEQATYRSDQAGAPMAAAGGPEDAGGVPVTPADLSGVVGLGEPSRRPEEPVTAGAAAGPGVGPEALGLSAAQDASAQYMRKQLPGLELMANMPGASDAFRQFVRRIKAAS